VIAMPPRRITYSLALTALVFSLAVLAYLAVAARPAQAPGGDRGRMVDPACAVMVSGTPTPGRPVTLPDGTGSCATR
jgi:hypothetical protein